MFFNRVNGKSQLKCVLQSILIACFAHGFSLIVAPVVWAAEPFPPEAMPGVSVGGNLPSGYEPSGIVWHSRLQRLFLVSDSGVVSSMNVDGTGVSNWYPGGDIEGITIAQPQSNFIYLGIENPDSIREFNITTGLVTRTFTLTSWMTGASNSGLEALTFVPNSSDPEGGLFYAGLQATGQIFVFQLPILSSTTSTTVTHIQTIPARNGITDLSGMHYETSQDVLYAIYDGANLLRAMETDGTLIEEWNLPNINQEGITLKGIELYICQDSGGVYRHAPFKVFLQPDLTADGMVNLRDFALMASQWGSGSVFDLSDLAIIADYWLECFTTICNGETTEQRENYLRSACMP